MEQPLRMQRPTHEYDSSSWGSIVTFQLLLKGMDLVSLLCAWTCRTAAVL